MSTATFLCNEFLLLLLVVALWGCPVASARRNWMGHLSFWRDWKHPDVKVFVAPCTAAVKNFSSSSGDCGGFVTSDGIKHAAFAISCHRATWSYKPPWLSTNYVIIFSNTEDNVRSLKCGWSYGLSRKQNADTVAFQLPKKQRNSRKILDLYSDNHPMKDPKGIPFQSSHEHCYYIVEALVDGVNKIMRIDKVKGIPLLTFQKRVVEVPTITVRNGDEEEVYRCNARPNVPKGHFLLVQNDVSSTISAPTKNQLNCFFTKTTIAQYSVMVEDNMSISRDESDAIKVSFHDAICQMQSAEVVRALVWEEATKRVDGRLVSRRVKARDLLIEPKPFKPCSTQTKPLTGSHSNAARGGEEKKCRKQKKSSKEIENNFLTADKKLQTFLFSDWGQIVCPD